MLSMFISKNDDDDDDDNTINIVNAVYFPTVHCHAGVGIFFRSHYFRRLLHF